MTLDNWKSGGLEKQIMQKLEMLNANDEFYQCKLSLELGLAWNQTN